MVTGRSCVLNRSRSRAWALTLGLAASFATPITVAAGKPDTLQLKTSSVDITATPISSFDGSSSSPSAKLSWRGGLKLTSGSSYFGGFSGLAILDSGRSLLCVSDAGFWLTARLSYDNGHISGLGGGRVGPIQALKGRSLERRRDRDAEAISVVSSGGANAQLLIGFENNARIGRFDLGPDGLSPPDSYLELPKPLGALRNNHGIESVAYLGQGPLTGNVLAFAERLRDQSGNQLGWIFSGKRAREIRLLPIGNFDISDATALPDGGVLVLERRFRWSEGINIRIRRLSPIDLQDNRPIAGETILEAGNGTVLDNMEGIAVHRSEAGETIVTLISDDNFNFFQSTILLQFALAG
ncbi:MAG: esterase-like activity of phytase family protein [Hyphomicrobiaceae bacterium]